MFDKTSYITNAFLKSQKYWIEKQKSSKRKINAKMALIHFLIPNLDSGFKNRTQEHKSNDSIKDDEKLSFLSRMSKLMDTHNNLIMSWKEVFHSIQSKSFEEYTIDDVRKENVDVIIELQALDQLLQSKIMVTIQSKFKINNITLHSQLTLDVFNINDVKLIHNHILSLCPNSKHRLNVPLDIHNIQKHNINFFENKITDSKGNIVFHLKQLVNADCAIGQSANSLLFQLDKNDDFLQKYHIQQKDLEPILSKVELDILNHPSKLMNNKSLITIQSNHQDYIQSFQSNDYLVQSNNNIIDMHLAHIDLYHVEYITRYDLKKNEIQYMQPKKEYTFNSFKDCLHQYKKRLDFSDYQNIEETYLTKPQINPSKIVKDISNEEFYLKDLANYMSNHAQKDITFYKDIFAILREFNKIYTIYNSSGYLTKLILHKYLNKYKLIKNRLQLFKHYVLLFNPDIKNLYYTGILNNHHTLEDQCFNRTFNMLSIINTCYPNLIKNLINYKKENTGLFPLIINAKLHDINNGVDDLLSFNKNKHLFDSKNQFKLLNKRKSSILTKIYMCLYISSNLAITPNIDDSFSVCFKGESKKNLDLSNIHISHENYHLLLNIRKRLFWLLVANPHFSIKHIHLIMVENFLLGALKHDLPYVKYFDNKTVQMIIRIIIQHYYQLFLDMAKQSKQNKFDWRKNHEEIVENFEEFSQLKRDIRMLIDFFLTLKESNTSIQDIKKYINETKWKNHFKTDDYNEIVTKCLTEKFDGKFLLKIIHQENNSFVLPLHNELKLNDKSTLKSLLTYIREYDKFYITQEQILDNQVVDYNQYPITIEKMQIGDVEITPILNSTELMYEGFDMRHCVYAYRDYCQRAEYVVFHIADKTQYNNIQNGQNVIKELTLGLSIFKQHYKSLKDIVDVQNDQKFKEYRNLSQDKIVLEQNPSHSNLYFVFDQCFGYKNDYIVNDEQIANINFSINQLLFKLNGEFLDTIGF